MIHHRNDKQIPESILISLYSHAVPKEDLISSMDNLISFDENASIFVENQKSQEILNEPTISNEHDTINSEVAADSEFSDKKSLNDLSKFLYYFNVNTCQIIKYDFFKTQFTLIMGIKDNVGIQLCLASYTQSLSAMAFFLLNSNFTNQDRYSKSYASHAIECIRNYDISSTFVPDFEIPPLLSIPIGEESPKTPTSVATSTTKLYIGGQNSINVIPLYRYDENKPVKISLPINNEQYSIAYVKCLDNITKAKDNNKEFLLFSSQTNPAIFIDPINNDHCPIRIVYRSIFSSKSYPFTHPVVSDGQYLYSVEFGSSPKLKIFIFMHKEILFIRSVSLQKGKNQLKQPFKDLLPIRLKDVASIATNGLFISFLFEIPQSECSLCRIFLVRNGIHVRDEIIHSPAKIKSWTFDLKRPSHCLIIETMMLLIDSHFTLPTWFIGFDDQLYDSYEMKNQSESIIDHYSYELSIYASYFIGSKNLPALNFNNINDIEPLENLILQFIEGKNIMATQAFLLLLPFKILNGDCENSNLLRILEKLIACFENNNFEHLHKQIVFAFLVSFDSFVQVSLEKSSLFLSEIIFSEQYSILLFKYLSNSSNLTKSLTPVSLKVLCEMALDSSFIFTSDAISLLRQIQSDLIVHENQMLLVFIKVILEHFINDLNLLMDNKWNEQRFLSCISFNIFKEMILIVENIRYDYDFSVYLIIEFFSVGSYFCKGCCSLVFKVIERSIHFAFEMFLHKIEEDKSFYKIESNFTNYGEFLGKKRNLKFDELGLNERIITEFKNIVENSYVANLDDNFIINEINIILDKVRSGQISEEKFIEKCQNVSKIQPQLFSNISHYFKNDIEFSVSDSNESICVKFISLFSSSIYRDSSSFRSVFLYFVPQIYHIRQCFLMVPNEIIQKFISTFKLWYFLMPEILTRSEISFDMINGLPTRALLYCEQTLFEISQNIQKLDVSFDENRMLRSLILHNLMNIKQKDFKKKGISLNEIVLKCLTTGNYEIIRQTMILILLLIDEENMSIIDKCLEFIGTYLNEEKIMFYYQTDRLICYQNCFLIADYLRQIIKKISINVYLNRIKSKGGFSYSEKLGFLLVMSNSIDTLRMNCYISVISKTGQKFSGIVTFFDDKSIAIETEDRSIQYLNGYNSYDCTFSGYYSFDPTQFKDELEFIKNLIFEFKPNLSFHNIFKFAALKEFMEIDGFCSLFNEEEIASIASKITRSLASINQSINDFTQLMIFHMTPLPIFAFNHSQNEIVTKPHSATVETMRNSFFNRTQQKDLTNVEISDTLISFDESSFFVSTPLHPTVNIRMTFNVHSSVTMDPQLTLTICMLGKSPNAFYRSQPLICDSSNETLIEIRPHLHSILIRNHSLHDINVFLQPSCEFIFITAKLASSTVVDYTFHYGYDVSTQSSTNYAEIIIPRMMCDENEDEEFVLPFQTSSIFVDAQMQEDTNNIVSHFALEAILHFPDFPCTYKFVSFALLNADQSPFDTNVDFKNFKKCQYTRFVEDVLNTVKEDDQKVQILVDSLMSEINTKWNRYKKSAFGPYNMTASIFAMSFSKQMLNQNNIYVVSNKQIYFNPNESQFNEFDGMTYIIRSDDITDSIVEFFVRVRHIASILLYVSNSNIFLVQNITKLIKTIQKENDSFIVSLDPIIEVLNRLVPKHRMVVSENNEESVQPKSRKIRKGLCYIGVTNVDVESKGFLNFSANPIDNSKKTVSQFTFDDDDDEKVDSHPAIINPSASESDIVLEKKIMKLKDWTVCCFPFFFENNVDNLDAQIEMFFSMNHSLKCFPLTNFLDQLFYCNSCQYDLDAVQRSDFDDNVITFENNESLNDEFIYLNIIVENKRLSIEISLDESFSNSEVVNGGSESFILPPITFYIRINSKSDDSKSDNFDSKSFGVKIRWKKFVFSEESFYLQIQNEVFKWKPCFSHQILLSFQNNEKMTNDLYDYLPVSTLISYEIASFFLHILREKPLYIENHTFDYKIDVKSSSEKVKKILSLLPELNYTSVENYRPKNAEEAAFVASLLFFSPKELNYTIPFKFWKDICELNSSPNLIFSRMTKVYQKIEPTYLRMICTKNNFSDAEIVLKNIIWINVNDDDERKKWIVDYINKLKPFVLNLFIECVTGHWGAKSLLESENPFILIQKVDDSEFLEFHQSIQVIAVGKYSQKTKLIDDLKLRMHQSIKSLYL